jgi:hypothetical protein
MLATLRDYYITKGIAAEGFNCPRQASCRSVSKDFVTAREAFVGSEYEKGTLPRVLFVSLDASSDHPGRAPSQRTLEYMRYWEENGESPPHGCDPDLLRKHKHWYRTHEFAHRILERTAMARGINPFQLRDVHRYFAHTNSAKCKDAARDTGQGPALVFDNCRSFIAPEVRLLKPDVLVTQGYWGHRSIDGQFAVNRTIVWSVNPQYACEILRIGDRPVLRFRLFHPRAFGKFHSQRREAYGWYIAVATAFFVGGPDAAEAVRSEA